ncbi:MULTISPECIES: helix-turn-helix domain-containing protein [unclassified Aureimonas]|uniref:helix-turn-helix domain-containing protein n=1 Tax=unclassified Aureimonas TaxID=2615206 RepID=UPI000701C448|nr:MULTISPECIES: helix-turn-helix domain-containing protein [unclassified Aureimonas]KQT55202.1 transcriptional regulator [Aureimonas sp. Leaf427]KQT70992.1 transcriptional regulator [Aureimonas sp. Leaf460]
MSAPSLHASFELLASASNAARVSREAGGQPLAGHVVEFAQDARIYDEGEATRSFYKVVGGMVRTCKYRSDGRRQIDGFHEEGDVFGLEPGTTYSLTAEAVSGCTLVAYKWRGLEAACGDGERSALVFGFALTSLQRTRDHALLLGGATAAQKVATFLVEMAERRQTDGAVDLVMCRQDIADYLGLTIETVSRTLSQFERKGLIALPSSRHVVMRDPRGLGEHCHGTASASA